MPALLNDDVDAAERSTVGANIALDLVLGRHVDRDEQPVDLVRRGAAGVASSTSATHHARAFGARAGGRSPARCRCPPPVTTATLPAEAGASQPFEPSDSAPSR